MSSWQAWITRSSKTWNIKFDLVIRACQRNVIWHLRSSYCYHNRFIIYPSTIIEKLWYRYLGSIFKHLFSKEKTNFRRTIVVRSWVEKHSKSIRKMHLCLGVGFVGFILKQIKYFVQILYDAIWTTSQYVMHCVLRKTLCTTLSVSERGDMDSENHSVVIWSMGSQSVKSTVLRLITMMVYNKSN